MTVPEVATWSETQGLRSEGPRPATHRAGSGLWYGTPTWVAIYGGGRVQRYSPAGVLLEELFVPAEQSTSCAFAGPGLTRLYVTTATEGWSEERRRAEPGAGLVYRFDTDARGRPAAPSIRTPRGGRRWHRDGLGTHGAIAQGSIDPARRPAELPRTEEGTQWLCALKTTL
jgi:SMP-30/Gluconolactonase/LRE-like region